jgi:APA family basic amino acid/polyamine antiporter
MFKNLLIVKPVAAMPHVDAGEPAEGSLQGEANLKRSALPLESCREIH